MSDLSPSFKVASMRSVLRVCAVLLLVQLVVLVLPTFESARGIASYLAVHMALELAAILVALMVFMMGWVHFSPKRSVNLVAPASIFLAVAVLDFSHLLSYQGMPDWITPSGPNKAIAFWFAARFTAALGLLAVAVQPWATRETFASPRTRYLAITMAWVLCIHFFLFKVVDANAPVFFVPGEGLTPLKNALEYGLVGIHLLTAWLIWQRGGGLQFNRPLLLGAVLTMAMSELFFTFYDDVTDVFNLMGHIYKVLAFTFVYRAFVSASVDEPLHRLEDLQQHQQALMDASPDLMFVSDAQGLIYEYHSPRVDLLVVPPADLVGKKFSDILPPDVAAVGMHAIDDCKAHGMSNGRTYALQLPAGLRWFELAATRFEQNNPPGERFLFLSRDITQRMLDAQEMRIFATAFESQQGMAITDAQQKFLRVNKAFSKITGFDASEVVGKTPKMLSSGRHTPEFYKVMWNAIRDTGAWRGEVWNRRKNGEVYPEWLSIAAVDDHAGHTTNYVAAFSDASLHKAAEDQIRSLAFSDGLTGLPNRRHLVVLLQQLIYNCAQTGCRGALILVDLDNFRTLNEALGQAKGDELLQQVAERLCQQVGSRDHVARVGGDSFAILMENLSAELPRAQAAVMERTEAVLQAMQMSYLLDAASHHLTSSAGITMLDGQQSDFLDEHFKRAEMAMYEAKQSGGNKAHFFTDEMLQAVRTRAFLESALREALQRQELFLVYQPQVNASGVVVGVEALIRWQHPERGLVSPAQFIPLAEETGLIIPIGHWVLETACNTLVRWAAMPALAHLKIAVNVSARQFARDSFVADLMALLAASGCPTTQLKLELTESSLVTDVESIIRKMAELGSHGITFSLDDFGTGYSSLAYLKRLPLNQLKIDQGFVRDILDDPNDAAIAKMVVALADSMGLDVIAEGVETQAQRAYLDQIGCKSYQGYLYGRPMDRAALEAWMQA